MVEMPTNSEYSDILNKDKIFIEDTMESLKVVAKILEDARAGLERNDITDLQSYIEKEKKSFSQIVLDEHYPNETRSAWGRHLQMLGCIELQLIARKENS